MGARVSTEEDDVDRTSFSKLKTKVYLFIFNKFPGFKNFAKKEIFEKNALGFNCSHIMNNLVHLDDSSVSEIMVQRSEIRAFCVDDGDLLNNVIKSQHTRVPVYKDNLDNIIGFVHIRDVLLKGSACFDIRGIIRDVMYVPHSMRAVSLFIKMQTSRIHMAIVLDEYGSTDGLVTMEDIIEQIVGNIEYEQDASSVSDIVNVSSDKIEVNARVLVRTLEQNLGIVLRDAEEDDEYDTVGGLIFAMVGRVPVVDEVFHHKSGAVFSIKEADNRCIYRVMVDLSGMGHHSD